MKSKDTPKLTPNEPACPGNTKFHKHREEIFEGINMMLRGGANTNTILNTLQNKWGISQKHGRRLIKDATSNSGYHEFFGNDATIILNAFRDILKENGCNLQDAWSFFTSRKSTTIDDYIIGRQQIPIHLQNNFYDYMNIKLTDGQLNQKSLLKSKPYVPCEDCINKGLPICSICLVTQYRLKQKLNMCANSLSPREQTPEHIFERLNHLIIDNRNLRNQLAQQQTLPPIQGYLPKFVGVGVNGGGYRVIQKQGLNSFITDTIKIEYRPVVKSDRDCMGRTVFRTFEEAEQALINYRKTGKVR